MSIKDPKGLGDFLEICFLILVVGIFLSIF